MSWPELDLTIHQPIRLRIMGLLHRDRNITYLRLRNTLQVSDGNLGSHCKRLAADGYIRSGRVFNGSTFIVTFRITPKGDQAFETYVEQLRTTVRLLDESKRSESQSPSPP